MWSGTIETLHGLWRGFGGWLCVRGRQWRMAPASLPSEPLSSLLCGAVCDSSEISFSITLLVRHLRIYAKAQMWLPMTEVTLEMIILGRVGENDCEKI